MPKYLIERRLPDAGKLGAAELQGISAKSNGVLHEMRAEGKEIQWLESYVTDNAIHCVYVAADAEVVREHAKRGGFPVDAVMQVREIIDPTTGE